MYYTYDKPLLEYVSPGKLFEYMAAKRPIVAADHPAIRSFLNDESAEFVAPENPQQLTIALQRVLSNPQRQSELAEGSFGLASGYTWHARADGFLSFVSPRVKGQGSPAAAHDAS